MTDYKLELNFDTNLLSIVTNDKSIIQQNTSIQYLNIPNYNFCVMRVNGIDISDNEFKFISYDDFFEIVNNYITEFNLTSNQINVSNNKFTLEYLHVDETNYVFDADLCSFTLYHISLSN